LTFDNRLVESTPVDRAGTLTLARGSRRLLAKSGPDIVRLTAPTDDELIKYLVHEDGFLRVPVLVLGDLLVRGFTEDLYREALASERRS
jgi:arsenate reductase-like glutaredoxin family protein